MGQLFTSGAWRVKEGKEQEFVEAWREIAEWTKANIAGASWAKLAQDRDDPRHFISFGPWDRLEAIEAWRESDGFRQRVGAVRELLESFEAVTAEVAAEVD